MTRQNNNHLVDIATYLPKNKRFKSFVYDHREIRNIANNLGCKTDHVRTELRKLGYSLIKNSNGQMVWKRDQLKHSLTVAGISLSVQDIVAFGHRPATGDDMTEKCDVLPETAISVLSGVCTPGSVRKRG